MLKFGGLIASGISWLGGQVGIFGGMAAKSPRGTGWTSILVGLVSVLGIKPEWVEMAANLVQRLAVAMQ